MAAAEEEVAAVAMATRPTPAITPVVSSPIAKKLPINHSPNGGGKQASNDPNGVPCAMAAVGGRQRCDRPGRWIYVE
ncbi:MAG: hypothetical protein ACOYOJ_16755 [Alsobacter sp.]